MYEMGYLHLKMVQFASYEYMRMLLAKYMSYKQLTRSYHNTQMLNGNNKHKYSTSSNLHCVCQIQWIELM